MFEKPLVLVTGGTGFLATCVIAFLFWRGYRVRTTVRSLQHGEEIKKRLHEAEISKEQISSLEVVEANLLSDDGWIDAMKDVQYVQHVASPFPGGLPKHEDELIRPVREGTFRVLRHADDAGSVIRVVLTSSAAANGLSRYEFTSCGELLDGNILGLPRIGFSVVARSRVSMLDIAKILKKNLGSEAYKVPTLALPNVLIRIGVIFLPISHLIVPN
ncbi:NAD dependent epimerase/dehydratase, putative [Talaromyces stipitatus ATCC 10500]|uniref:NAD dependent epimerase/dehydratase, putative n=1 Tax=Talaromyces stipitatus (strain ATCC 10500 / CBS 375.48 / QM 6759 / NRRL 1006) TaxID=441959 RepID=B8LVH7_TALSN|nr:NAD dependent epimerase/dehydratase, putative [Talaromyces stipitatus ATCC 10500]EED23996.1 NAD dependent epimerase/dehydratase, putative [Talaromyces stipitatus ATCC 10500]